MKEIKKDFQKDELTIDEQAEYKELPPSKQMKWKYSKGIEQAARRNLSFFNSMLITSYGADNGSIPKGSEKQFDCRRLNLRGHSLDLRKGRGCDPEFQKVAQEDEEFKEFIILAVKFVLENGYRHISFYCSKGHHRSVAAATLFCRKFAPSASVIHTCLKK